MKIRRKIDYRIEPHPLDEKEFTKQNQFADEILSTGLQIFRYEKEKGTQHWLVGHLKDIESKYENLTLNENNQP
jgi:hypothetical protein